MAKSKLRDDYLAHAQYNRLVNAACRGEAMAVKAVLDADGRVGYLSHEQGRALLKACVTTPHAVALLAIVQQRSDQIIRGITSYLGMAFVYASLHGADVATVQYIVKGLQRCSAPTLERDLVWATTTRNVPLVLGAAIKTSDQLLVLQFMGLPAVQAFLASLEASFKPCFIRRVATHHHHQQWLTLAMMRNMQVVVAMVAERCPLVTADVAWVHCASRPTSTTKYADLCERRGWLNDQIQVFHQAIQAGNTDLVSSMLEVVPALRRSRMENDVTALMASTLAPNAIALLQCLLDRGATNKAVVQALVHACKHGAAAASIDRLWNWVEALDRNDRRRDCALWKAINGATSHQQLVAVQTLLEHVRDWKTSQASDFIMSAIDTQSEDFACAVMELPVVEAYFKTLKDKGLGSILSDESGRDAWNSVGVAVSDWIDSAVRRDRLRVTACLDKWWPALTRRVAFMQYNNESSTNTAMWSELSQQYARDVTWHHARDAYLVQRRVLPGLDHLGWLIATYVYAFDAQREYSRRRYLGMGYNHGGDEYGRCWLS